MSIIGLQRRLVEVGRIRMGEKIEITKKDGSKGTRPARLDNWRLTSRDQLRLTAASKVFGGEVKEWEGQQGQYELYTTVDSLPILLMPGQAISQHYELWSGGGCKRRCDGEQESLSDGPCLCDPEARECKPHTRLNVLLPDVAGVGVWRLDTQGYYAAIELTGTVDLLELATTRGVLLPARLRIDQRVVLRDGETKRFPVPTLDIDVRPLEMRAITQGLHEGEVAALPAGYKPVVALQPAGTTVAQGIAGAAAQVKPAERKSARSAAPLGEVGDFGDDIPAIPIEEDIPLDTPPAEPAGFTPGTGASDVVPPAEAEDPDVASYDQQRLLMLTAREHEWKDADRYDLTEKICGEGIRSVKKVPKDKVDMLLTALQNPVGAAVIPDGPTNDQLIGELRSYGEALSIRGQVDDAVKFHGGDREWLLRQIERLKAKYEEGQKAKQTEGAA